MPLSAGALKPRSPPCFPRSCQGVRPGQPATSPPTSYLVLLLTSHRPQQLSPEAALIWLLGSVPRHPTLRSRSVRCCFARRDRERAREKERARASKVVRHIGLSLISIPSLCLGRYAVPSIFSAIAASGDVCISPLFMLCPDRPPQGRTMQPGGTDCLARQC